MTKTSSTEPVADLTHLSLRELYNLEVVQMNVLGAHTHPKGEFMIGYEYMYMNMEGIRDGGHGISPADVFAKGFSVAHTRMEMQEHMVELMYAPTDRLTLMAMLPYKQMSMNHLTSAGTTFAQNADGVGDLQVMGMITLLSGVQKCGCGQRLLLNIGMGFPTGSINMQDHAEGNPAKPLVKLEYPMQLGSGTYDLLPGLTYLGDSDHWAWGVQTLEFIRLGTNSEGYRFGNQYELSAWLAYGLTEWFAPSVRLEGKIWKNIHGADPAFGAHPRSAEATPTLQAGERLNALLGLNFYIPRGVLKGTRIMIEGGLPIYEHLRGPQLGLNWAIGVGVTYAF